MAAVSQADIRQVVDLVYGEHVANPSGEELSAAKRVLHHEGMTTNKVRLMMLIAGSSPNYFAPMFETACARGFGVRKLESQLAGLTLALRKDPSAPGNRAAEEAYHEKPDTPEQAEIKANLAKSFAKLQADVQKPWADLIEQARKEGLTGPRLARWVFAKYAELHPEKAETAKAADLWFSRASGNAAPPTPARRQHIQPQRMGNPSAPKRHEREPVNIPEPDYPDDDEPRRGGEED